MATATLHHGTPRMVDHTPSSDVAAGDVLVIGDVVRIAHRPIAAGELGAVGGGGGVYRAPKAAALAINDGDTVYFDAADDNFNKTATDNTKAGVAVGDAAAADTHFYVHHQSGT
ncbi:capsid cement protein [Alienimonas sp. DA493]|uniref:capsid cement protein n=1 Tax=Alienimonas sp. DA493 TaxID=3373605 RepID=UPI003753EA14